MNRRDVLLGSLFGLASGAGLAKSLDYLPERVRVKTIMEAYPGANFSFAQQGEDLIIKNIFDIFKIAYPSYVDIGAYDPTFCSNTFLFYLLGSKGLLIEPNPDLCGRLISVRPKDTVLNIGIGVTDQKEADYYILEGSGQTNTFSKEEADGWGKIAGHSVIKKVIKMPLVNINEVLQQHFKRGPDLLSVDAEGFDERIIKSLDFERFRPKVICAETSELGTGKVVQGIAGFLEAKNYSVRGGTFINSVFFDNTLLPKCIRPVNPGYCDGSSLAEPELSAGKG
jgi:FkbM family methyltransferase